MLPTDLKHFKPSQRESDVEFMLSLLGAAFLGWAVIYLLAKAAA